MKGGESGKDTWEKGRWGMVRMGGMKRSPNGWGKVCFCATVMSRGAGQQIEGISVPRKECFQHLKINTLASDWDGVASSSAFILENQGCPHSFHNLAQVF